MPIDLASVDWLYVGLLAVFVFVASGLGSLLSLAWTYYPHGLPLPTSLASQKAAPAPAPAAPAAPAAPQRPRNPVTDITPPAR